MAMPEIAVIVAVVTLAACVQGCIGFGMALIAAPILVLVDPALVPGPLMASGLLLVSLVALRDRAHADLETVRWAILGNVGGAAAGAWVLTLLDASGFSLLFGLLVLVGVALSASGLHVRVSRGSTLGAGMLGGFMATTSAIGGPPVALVYQHSEAARTPSAIASRAVALRASADANAPWNTSPAPVVSTTFTRWARKRRTLLASQWIPPLAPRVMIGVPPYRCARSRIARCGSPSAK